MKSIILKTAVPGPKSLEWLERRKKVVSNGISLGKIPIVLTEGQGALVTDCDGNRYIDFTGGIGCLNSGHSPSRVIEAAIQQAQKLQHTCFQVTMYESYLTLAEKLVQIAPGKTPKKVAFFNSGAEAVENAIKIARRYTKRQAIVSFENAFHGRTFMALSLTSKVKPYKDGFAPFNPEVYHAPLPYLFKRPAGVSELAYVDEYIAMFHRFLKTTVAPDAIAAIILEPVLGEGGFIVPPEKFVSDLSRVCKENGILFIADEIQSGFARTGKMFASEHFGIEPDLMTMAKSLSNGFPLSAVLGKAEVMDSMHSGGIGSTFGGNPVSCAAALAAIQTIEEEKLCDRAHKIGEVVKSRLHSLMPKVKCIGEVRGLGAMIGIEIVKNGREPDKETAEKIVLLAGQKGLLLLTAGVDGNIIRTLMPLCITDDELMEALDIFESVVKSL